MAKPKLLAGRINRKCVGYIESPADAHVMLEWARARAHTLKPKELRVVISKKIAPSEALDIALILKIHGYESRGIDQIFSKAVAKSPYEKLAITVLNPRILFFKEKAHKKLAGRYEKAFKSRQDARLRLTEVFAELNKVEVEIKATNSKISDLQRDIRTVLLVRAAAKSTPLHLRKSITADDLRLHYAFLFDPLFLEENPPVLKPAADISERIAQLRASLGLPLAGGQAEVSQLLSKLRGELALLIRRLVTLDLDKDVLLQHVNVEETAINTLNDLMPGIMTLMRSKSDYGAEGMDEDGRPGGQAPPTGADEGLGDAAGGAPAPSVAST